MRRNVDWSAPVELSESGAHGHGKRLYPDLTLRQAVDLFEQWPVDRQNRAVIMLKQPVPLRHNGRWTQRYCLNGWGIRDLAGAPSHDDLPADEAPSGHRRGSRRRYRGFGVALVTISVTAVIAALKAMLISFWHFL